jgi:FtsP/CotA-like multicopper oxidase with cupredoxin domain
MSNPTIPSAASRRRFMKMTGLAGLALGTSACAGSSQQEVPVIPSRVVPPTPTSKFGHGSPAGHGGAAGHGSDASGGKTADVASAQEQQEHDMDAMHEAGVKVFLDNIGKDATFWRIPFEPKMDGDVKVFEVTASEVEWEVTAGNKVKGMGYNNAVPGPEIRVTEGDKVRIVLTNNLKESTAIHFHGVLLPNEADGVPFITQPAVKPGQTFNYEFTAKNPGSHMYHSHLNAAAQVTAGLLGAFVIEPKDKSKDPAFDSEYTFILNDVVGGFTINGKGFPNTQPIQAKLGERIRIRYMNEGLMIHPMHLHGLEQVVFAKDGWNLPQPFTCDTLNVAPGERWDVIVTAHTPGVWAFHCHVLTHAESPGGMFGMVTVMIVK